jgi:hypothetical protein
MKVKGLLIITLTLLVTLFSGVTLFAEDANLSPYVKVVSDPVRPYVREIIDGGVSYYQRNLSTLYNGNTIDPRWDDQTVSVLSVGDATAIQIVAWQQTARTGWGSSSLRDSIEDFEAQNPGFIVVAGVNGDFSDVAPGTQTFQPANNFVSNGDVLKKDTCAEASKGTIGFFEGHEFVYGDPVATDSMYLKIYENQNYDNEAIKEKMVISSINSLSTTGIVLLNPSVSGTLDVTGYKVFKGEYTDFKESNNVYPVKQPGKLGSFLKGRITEISENTTVINDVLENEFYLLSKDGSLDGVLNVESTLKCEYELTGSFTNVPNTMGYTHQILSNGTPSYQNSTDLFINTTHPRTMVGFKEDGSAVFMVVDGRGPMSAQRTGISLFEGGELLRLNDCVTGFNLDGGGSSTMIIRNASGELVCVNTPSDGNERKVANSLLLVIQDPHIGVTGITDSSITVERTAPIVKGSISNIQVRLDGTTVAMENDQTTFTGLQKGTEYYLSYTYDLEIHGKTLKGLSRKSVITTDSRSTPVIDSFRISSSTGNSITFRYGIEDDDLRVVQAYIQYGESKFTVGTDQTTATVTDLPLNEELSFRLVLEYDSGRLVQSEALTKTLTGGSAAGCAMGSATAFYMALAAFASSLFVVFKKRSN